MTIFLNNLKRLSRDRFTQITIFILPVIFISFAMFAMGGSSSVDVAVIDLDNTPLTSMLKAALGDGVNLEEVQEQDIKQKLIDGKLVYAIKIDQGFTEALIEGRDARLETYSLTDTNVSRPVKYFVDGFVNSAKNIAAAAKGSEEVFYKGMDAFAANKVSVDYINIENTERDKKANTYLSLGFLVMFMLYIASNSATLVLEDKQLNTYSRVLSSPVTTRGYFLQNLLSFITIMMVQVAAIFFMLTFVFKADMGPSVFNLFILFNVFALTAVTLGVAISSFAKDLRQANAMTYLISVPMCMLGGCFWPRDIMPQLLQQLANFIPVTWVLKASEKLLYGGSLSSIAIEMGILLLFALVFLIIGSNRKIMMASK